MPVTGNPETNMSNGTAEANSVPAEQESQISVLCVENHDSIFGSVADFSFALSPTQVVEPPTEISKNAYVKSLEEYEAMYKKSISDPEEFWKEILSDYHFKEKQPDDKPFLSYNFDVNQGPVSVKWLEGAKTNISYNLLDRNVQKGLGDTIAFYWEGNDPKDESKITYGELLKEVCKFANVLKSLGVKKGDRVAIYMPMIMELPIAMLGCARIGAIHSIVFGGFSADSLTDRMIDAQASVLITSDGVWRGEKIIHLKEISDKAIAKCGDSNLDVKHCIVVNHLPRLAVNKVDESTNQSPVKRKQFDYSTPFDETRDKWYHELIEKADDVCPPEWVDAEDPLFMLYTSGSTGKPKGVLHTTAGYMIYAATTFKYVFDYHPGDIYWCTADIGWITGHTYVTYGPLANGATSVIFEGTPFYPTNSRFWDVVDKYKVNQFYTAPTAIRSLMKFGDKFVKQCSRSSLKILGTVGEPINPEAWLWYYNVVGDGRCPIVDTYWQTETGGHVITPLPGATPSKPGSATFPFFGVLPVLLTEEGKEIEGPGEGYLVFKKPWPGIMRTVYGDHDRFEATYFKRFPGYYFTGDGAKRDKDGYLWITGRVDDMLNVSGHLLSTAQVESALIEHKGWEKAKSIGTNYLWKWKAVFLWQMFYLAVAESAAVAMPHKVKGEALYCFVTLRDGFEFTPQLEAELKLKVREKIGAFAAPEVIQLAPALPKTRSGKIMRRILRKIAVGDSNFGDTSTLADESVIDLLLQHRPETAAKVR